MRRFKIEIEDEILTPEQLQAVNDLIRQANRESTKSLKDLHLCLFPSKHYDTLNHGLGGSHYWLSQSHTGNRILLITEN